MNSGSISRNIRRAAAFLVAGTACLVGVSADDAPLVIKGFKTRGLRKDGTTHWEMQGGQATLQGVQTKLDDMTLKLHTPQDVVTITSPNCLFNTETKIAASEGALHAETRTYTLDGVGYEVDTQGQRLSIRSKVRMVIRGTPHTDPVNPERDGRNQPDLPNGD